MDTSGFYKYQDGHLYYGYNGVHNQNYELLRTDKDNLELPVDGWYWFDSRMEALTFYGIKENEEA